MPSNPSPLMLELCLGSSCYCRGNRDISAGLKELLARRDWTELVEVKGSLCRDACAGGPHISIDSKAMVIGSIVELEGVLEAKILEVADVRGRDSRTRQASSTETV